MVAVGEFLCVFIFAVGNCLAVFSSTTAPLIPSDEVKTLQTISQRLNIRYWTVSQTSCSDGYQSFNRIFTPYILSNVTCDCSRDDTCHVTNIQLKSLNLSGVLPVEFANLKHLRELDLTWNYISGSIPTIFSRLRLTVFVLLGNRISGRIPDAIGHIPTLEELNLEDNQLGGSLPESLGNLNRLRRLMLSANNFSGTIPESFGRLKNLSDFRIDGNRMSGKIPEFIGNWARLSVLNMQGASLEGPIPKTISRLQQLNELRISDLSGRIMGFPNLRGMLHLQTLILRNCLINDQIPNYITELANLTTVDMSFNQLTGNIPDLSKLKNLTFLFLTNNSLTGAIPGWILRVGGKQHFDLSYNNFTDPTPTSCQQQSFNLNLVSSHSSMKGNSDNWCFVKDLPCSTDPQYYSLFINCGGRKIKYNRSWFEEDRNKYGFSNFIAFGDRWAYSSTGLYMYNDGANVTASDTFGLHVDGPEYFKTARLSPLSLKYYGLCLRQGSYRVQLHFAEIMYSNDTNFSSLGRRIFDVAIQRNIVLKDFNIAEEAGGVGKGITKDFKEVHVNGTTLEIHLYWAGQGTTAIPNRGVYGPLISGITVTPNFKIKTGLSTGVIVGIVLASFVLLVLGVVCLRMKGYLGGTDHDNADLRGLNTNFSLRQIKAATNDFSFANKIGEGGFGPVYKGVLQDGTEIAVKRLSNKSKQGIREFGNEMGTISALQHPNLVKLYGCCVDGKELLLIYEYLQNNSLHHALFGGEKYQLNLEWPTRQNICLGIAKGLAFLHEESTLKIVHRDIKATNVLLDKDLNAKISDFGLAKLDDEENTHITTRIAGTLPMSYKSKETFYNSWIQIWAQVTLKKKH